MIYVGSRYELGELYYDENNDTPFLAFGDTNTPIDERIDFIYQFKEWDRLDLLAERFYGNPQYRWIILYANPQYITEFDIKVGDTLVIPNPERM